MAADNVSDTNCDFATTGTKDEFIELVNVSSKVIDLTGVTISDSLIVRHTFADGPRGSMLLAPGKAVVVWGGGAPACAGVTDWFVASSAVSSASTTPWRHDTSSRTRCGAQLISHTYPAATLNKSSNLIPDVTGTVYVLHDAVTGAVGDVLARQADERHRVLNRIALVVDH